MKSSPVLLIWKSFPFYRGSQNTTTFPTAHMLLCLVTETSFIAISRSSQNYLFLKDENVYYLFYLPSTSADPMKFQEMLVELHFKDHSKQ
jgi:hypothetical protein